MIKPQTRRLQQTFISQGLGSYILRRCLKILDTEVVQTQIASHAVANRGQALQGPSSSSVNTDATQGPEMISTLMIP